jgi:hypothetical protein
VSRFDAHLEDFSLVDLRDFDEVHVGVVEDGLIGLVLDDAEVDGEEAGEEEGEVEDELLILVGRVAVDGGNVCAQAERGRTAAAGISLVLGGIHLLTDVMTRLKSCAPIRAGTSRAHQCARRQSAALECERCRYTTLSAAHLVVLWPDLQPADLGQAFESDVAELRHLEKLDQVKGGGKREDGWRTFDTS